ncbi:type IV secretory system conjugative DNA transfer family protein [Streptomyces sp. NPDC049879]|uniref:type IV secretory system conjugative DNA transfer family protein n=1 Tax=Streptomyces sp. NPDC049879 TaxID=3365598 RepID=UPI0037905929
MSGWEALFRSAGAMWALLNPVSGLVALVVLVGGRSSSLGVRWTVTAVGGGLAVLLGLSGGWELYLRPYGEALESATVAGGPVSLLADAGERWPVWLACLAPGAVASGLMVGGGVLVWRWRFRAPWREVPAVLPDGELADRVGQLRQEEAVAGSAVSRVDDLTVRMGVDVHTGEVFGFPAAALREHTLVSGATGSGKSSTVARLIYELTASPQARGLAAPVPVVFADMKADPAFVREMGSIAEAAGRRFRLITVTGDGERYNPIRHGTAPRVCARIVETLDQTAGGGFESPHHREAAEVYLRHVMVALDDLVHREVEDVFLGGVQRAWRRDLPDLGRLMGEGVRGLAERVPLLSADVAHAVHTYLVYLSRDGRDLRRSLPGLTARIQNMSAGDAERVLTDDPSGIDLLESIGRGDVVLASLASAYDARAARQVGSLLLTDLASVGHQLLATGWGTHGMFLAGVDEFTGLGGTAMAGMFARMRAAGGALLLATQDLADLEGVSPAFAAQVVANSNVVIVHRQAAGSRTASTLLGTEPAWEETIRVHDDVGLFGTATATLGEGTLRPVRTAVVPQDVLRKLPRGRAVLAVGDPLFATGTVQVAMSPASVLPVADAVGGECGHVVDDVVEAPADSGQADLAKSSPEPRPRVKGEEMWG